MASTLTLRTGLVAGAVILTLSAGPAMAGRCGHSYPVDVPVSLVEVARACNVSLAALKEANPGVNPASVRPGRHLAVPDEIDAATDIPPGYANVEAAGGDYNETPIYRYVEYNEPAAAPSPNPKAANVAAAGYAANASPYFVRASTGAPQPFFEDRNLSYQQRSAARIRHAVAMTTPAMMAPARPASPGAVTISSMGEPPHQLYGDPLSPVMECSVLRRQPDGKIRQVREFKPLPEGREAPAHCAVVESASLKADGAVLFTRAGIEALPALEDMTVLEGYVSAADADCITVMANDGATRRVAVDLAPVDLLGKYVTLWAEDADAGRCGGLVMSRAVYVEPVR
ncbi:LysM peptidoglycan-binding domain-containing protein [Hyphococcus luteus]|uniref:LysM domain-containing protein n=1 Tax=Hyphococcus luteus TaxID=2058213 RepID=A0A2S7K2I7_9PROT|nr:LysM peptidoglycan-binding domain-containing protein [Marinicaulis flavus]PQA86713.1 hypothetical protein CW354_14575 [Marinicaulis flavus]